MTLTRDVDDHYRKSRAPSLQYFFQPIHSRRLFAADRALDAEQHEAKGETDEGDRKARGGHGGDLGALVGDLHEFNHGGVRLDGVAARSLRRRLSRATRERNPKP